MSVQTIHFLRPQPLRKEYTSTFFECQNPHENNINQAKKLTMYGKNVDFHRHLPSPLKMYGLYTHENVNIYGRPKVSKIVHYNSTGNPPLYWTDTQRMRYCIYYVL